MEKRISINIERQAGLGDRHVFKITQMHNAGSVRFPQSLSEQKSYGVGDLIPAEKLDEFARDKRWETSVKLGK